MNRYNILFVLLLITCPLSCGPKSKSHLNQDLIKSIAKEDSNYVTRFSNLFFCRCQNNEVLVLDIDELKEIYVNEYRNMDYYDFLIEMLNQETILDCRNRSNKFKINVDVEKNYKKNMRFDEFLAHYCMSNGDNLYRLKTNISDDKKNTIFYFLFLNNYLTSFDDYSGSYVIINMHNTPVH